MQVASLGTVYKESKQSGTWHTAGMNTHTHTHTHRSESSQGPTALKPAPVVRGVL